jgi:hypothetical protein
MALQLVVDLPHVSSANLQAVLRHAPKRRRALPRRPVLLHSSQPTGSADAFLACRSSYVQSGEAALAPAVQLTVANHLGTNRTAL